MKNSQMSPSLGPLDMVGCFHLYLSNSRSDYIDSGDLFGQLQSELFEQRYTKEVSGFSAVW